MIEGSEYQRKENERVRQRALSRGIPESALTDNGYGWLEYSGEKVARAMERIHLDKRVLGNRIYLYLIPENGKWVMAVDWVSKNRYDGHGSHPSPLWDDLYDSREAALSAAWRWFEKKGIERPDAQPDLFGGDYS